MVEVKRPDGNKFQTPAPRPPSAPRPDTPAHLLPLLGKPYVIDGLRLGRITLITKNPRSGKW